ncbi:MAG: helix-turn-helix transcriptional regulator [Clostridia bacterium]|jgi:transcriptional regulator with XRE-family HTH domain|nr:helix-turn-helix transcriptional regulator [Clostridiaceae bacterium]
MSGNIGQNIKRFREEKKMTQEQLAEQMNVTRQAVSNWENGKTLPNIDTLFRLSLIFEISIEEIIYGEKRKLITNVTKVTNQTVRQGVGFGAVLAMIISYVKWHSIGWAIFHGALNWAYVIYFVIKYGWNG